MYHYYLPRLRIACYFFISFFSDGIQGRSGFKSHIANHILTF